MSASLEEIAIVTRAETLAISPLARKALESWRHAQVQAAFRHRRDGLVLRPGELLDVRPARDALDLNGPALGAPDPEWLVDGRAVWFSPALPAGIVKFIRGQVVGRRDNLGRILIANIDEPIRAKQQLYVPVRRLRQRFAGEVAPGIFHPNPNGDDAA